MSSAHIHGGSLHARKYKPFARIPYLVTSWTAVGSFFALAAALVSQLLLTRPTLPLDLLMGIYFGAFALALPFVIVRIRCKKALKAWVAKSEEAGSLLRVGEYERAVAILDELADVAVWEPSVHAVVLHGLAAATLHTKRPARALSLFQNLDDSGWFESGPLSCIGNNQKLLRALGHAIAGDIGAASKLRDEVGAGLPESRRGATMLVDAVIGARRGTLGEPPAHEELRLAESALMLTHVRAIPILHAFAKDTGHDDYRTATVDAPTRDRGGLARGDLDFLAVEWPELAAYLDGQGLAGAA